MSRRKTMTRKALSALALSVALALAGTAVVVADSHEGETFDPASVEEWNQDEALILFQQLQEKLLAMGVAPEDMGGAVAYLEETFGNLSEADVDELLAGQMLAESDAEMGDDEFGQAEEDEPELGDEEEEESE
jgi:hypothetical protein